MKTKLQLTATVWLFLVFSSQRSVLHAQGSLAPPGPPAPTMKSLDQIEARTPISSAPFTITDSGSYYLTANLSVAAGDAVTITANGVTLDLNGFTISSTEDPAATGSGILLANPAGNNDITVLNGHIKGGVANDGSGDYAGSGFGYGIYYSGSAPVNVRVSGVSVSGCLIDGIYLGSNNTAVESCTAQTVGSYGIMASAVWHSTATDCGSDAIVADNASDCRGSSGGGYGINVNYIANNCLGQSLTSHGVSATTANNCYGYSSSSDGVNVTIANNCYGYNGSSDGYALIADTANNCRGESAGGTGIYATTATGCHGQSGGSNDGLYAFTAINCYGQSNSGYGLYASGIATGCYGQSNTGYGLGAEIAIGSYGVSSSYVGITAFIGNSCYGQTPYYIPTTINHPYNMP